MDFKLVYQPDEGERQDWVINLITMPSFEAELLEAMGGPAWGTYEEFGNLLSRGSVRALRALLWMMLRRANPRLDFDDVIFRHHELWTEDIEAPELGKDNSDDSDTDSPSPQPDSEPSQNNSPGQ